MFVEDVWQRPQTCSRPLRNDVCRLCLATALDLQQTVEVNFQFNVFKSTYIIGHVDWFCFQLKPWRFSIVLQSICQTKRKITQSSMFCQIITLSHECTTPQKHKGGLCLKLLESSAYLTHENATLFDKQQLLCCINTLKSIDGFGICIQSFLLVCLGRLTCILHPFDSHPWAHNSLKTQLVRTGG